MRPVELSVNGSSRRVAVHRTERGLSVELDGVRHDLDAVETEPGRWSLLMSAEHVSHEVLVRAGRPGEWVVIVDGAVVPVAVVDRRRLRGGGADVDGEVRVLAPMPGRVVRVLVQPGQPVAARDPLVVVEAMKMENELRAPRAATVRSVSIREGVSVDAGALLVTLE